MVKLRRIFESDLYLESKKDLDDLKNYLGNKLFDDYMKIRDRIPKDQNEFKDFSKLKKMDKKDIQDFISSFQSKSDKKKSDKTEGAKKLYEDEDWVVYRITTYPAAQLYGKNTKWCITGRYEGHEEQGQDFFDDYINRYNLDGGYYFYISKKNPKEKYCILQTKDKDIHSIWDAEDTNHGVSLDDLPDYVLFPEVKEVNIRPYSIEQICKAIDNYHYPSDVLYNMIDSMNVDDLNKFYEGCTPITYAIMSPREDCYTIVSKLLSKGVNVNKKDKLGYVPLSPATRDPQLLELLVDNSIGIDIDLQDRFGYTPLFYASCVNNNYESTKFLLECGADPNIKNNNGGSILGETRNPKIRELLIKYGAKE